jgi:hypothetical protein
MTMFLVLAATVSAQKKEATFTLSAKDATTLYHDISGLYGGCYTVGYQFDPLSIAGNGRDTVFLQHSLNGTDYYSVASNRYPFTSATTAASSIYWDTLCYPYYRIKITNGLGSITSGTIITTIYFIRIE